jgi:hypothetical protein
MTSQARGLVYVDECVCVCVCVCIYTGSSCKNRSISYITRNIWNAGLLCLCKNTKSRAAAQVKRKILFCHCCKNKFISLRLLDHISEDSGLRDVTPRRHVSVSRHFEGTFHLSFQGLNSVYVLLNCILK